MLPLREQKSIYQTPKCYFTYGAMVHVDPKQPPSKGKPWTTLASRDFIHQVDLILPQEIFSIFQQKVLNSHVPPQYKRVTMTLGQVLEKDFFQEYLKIGNILMLSEGRPGQDNVFTIKDGKLTMFLDRETYERAGMVGITHGVKGERGLRPRWIVEYDLRAPASFPGKKGFDRLIYATKNALNFPVTWLFCNLGKTPEPDPLLAHFPTTYTSTPGIAQDFPVLIPELKPESNTVIKDDRDEAERFATETYEWLSLVRLGSPRVSVGDEVDPYISQYSLPDGPKDQEPSPGTVSRITWRGLLAADWARSLFIELLVALPSKSWFSLSINSFAMSKGLAADSTDLTIMRPPNTPGEYLQWEIKGHE
ncbi:hypothetical protein MGG_06856 [Pyricularia oryzae 70-15]|uniref:Uncharacterized protein n=3 Tax=Pyricularia oryzae TaxID=318829 RepID=G4MMI6_PYRO7|nr:uncharacterized protein MGG_06856 [Pyricularia oryzae 70-15]EHA56964.1 hypothetical protein MGG_06856 [Pyricularia oryzae 70-15]ELQ43681.1 hypothetical protein OOU_Y34scaffold00140g89 [Pyricularia oryzae Y34]KAI7920810.1 hypothetical protein M9X92_005697 [Pyricularia oryzae]KAI7931004.1 hypothetical protein M0657_001366 [Pyricularia oryzae]